MWRIALLMIVALAVTLPVQAKPKKGHKQHKERVEVKEKASFSPAERNLIRSQLLSDKNVTKGKSPKNLPPGLQKKVARGKSLPPGWQKKVAAGRNLDYQVYRQGESLPDILLRRLPPAPIGSEIIRVEDKIIRLNSATRTILDVFNLIPAN